MEIQIKPLSPELLDDYLEFFDNAIFTDNPEWSKCYCYSYHFTGTSEQWNREQNRKAVIDLINKNYLRGYLAYDGTVPIGWCNANDRQNFQSLSRHYDLPEKPAGKICSIVCFVVHPDYRRKGVAQRILEQISKDYSTRDYDCIEAYPAKGNQSCEGHYRGPLALYNKSGFIKIDEQENNFIVRKDLLD